MRKAETLGAVYIYIYIYISISLQKSSENLGLVLVQKIYIKYKNLKDGLCKKIARPFCVQKGVMDTS